MSQPSIAPTSERRQYSVMPIEAAIPIQKGRPTLFFRWVGFLWVAEVSDRTNLVKSAMGARLRDIRRELTKKLNHKGRPEFISSRRPGGAVWRLRRNPHGWPRSRRFHPSGW